MVRAIGEDGEATVRRELVTAVERGVADEKLDAARRDVRVHAHGVDALRTQHATQRDLRTDAIAVGPLVTDDDHPLAFHPGKEIRELRLELRVETHAFGSPFPFSPASP